MKDPLTREELLIDMESRLEGPILEDKLIDGNVSYNYYVSSVKVTDNNNIAVVVQTVGYFVFDEGTASEEAYYEDGPPSSEI